MNWPCGMRVAMSLGLVMAYLGNQGRAEALPTLPNILWIVAEDINPHLGCYGDANATTPNLDRFAARGLRYTHCWSSAPVCAPARTALISGVSPTSLGAEHMRSMVRMPDTMRLYPQLLRERGYYCSNNNKEDYNVRVPGVVVWDESSNKAHWRNRKEGQPFFAVFNLAITHESQIRKRPHTLQHDPGKVRLPAYHPDTPEARHDWAQYYDNITTMDRQFAERLAELEADGLAASTIVFFYGDNGSGMPRSKRWPYNSGLNVPLLVHVPDALKSFRPAGYGPGQASGRLINFEDFAPTLLSLAGAKPPGWMQGRAFLGQFQTPDPAYAFGFRGRMDERYDLVRSSRNQRFVYIRNFMPHLIYGQHIDYMFETPTTRVWKELYDAKKLPPVQARFWQGKPPEELYDLEKDPDEVENLAEDAAHRTVRDELRAALRQHLLEIRDTGFLPEAERLSRAGTISVYELGHDPKRYPMDSILEMAELASSLNPEAEPRLRAGLKAGDSAVRYWAALGLLMRGSNAVASAASDLRPALKDVSPSVRVAAARALGLYGSDIELTLSLAVLKNLASPADNGVFISLEALSAIEALGARAEPLRAYLRTMPVEDPQAHERLRNYVPRLVSNLIGEKTSALQSRPKKSK